jgi:hypothetical protein
MRLCLVQEHHWKLQVPLAKLELLLGPTVQHHGWTCMISCLKGIWQQ